MPDLKPDNIQRVVVRGTNWVGDAVMTVPALRELRRVLPKAHITLATRSWAKGLFAEADFIDDLLISDQRGLVSTVREVGEWRERNFDLALLLPNSFAAGLIPALARVPIRVGYATDGRRILLTVPLSTPAWRGSRHETFYYLNIVRELGQRLNLAPETVAQKPDSSLHISANRKAEALKLLRSKGVNEGRAFVALCPGSTNSRAKRWPAERYAAVGDLLIKELGANVLLIGSQDELDVSLDVENRMSNKPIVLTGQTDLAQAVAVLSRVDLLITNDTGPAHIAAALERPTLVIFGPTNPKNTKPFSDKAELVREPPDCAPCGLRDCPIDHRCMTAISPEQVFERARSLLVREELPPGNMGEKRAVGIRQ
jgi:lipopolysaccharide heptosyltransferase II